MEYKVSELAQMAGVTKRTIHYYISKGLLFPSSGSGINSTYNDKHLKRILLIKKLQSEFMPLSKIREVILNGEDTSNTPKQLYGTQNKQIYIKENVCNVLELHYTQENAEKYKHIIENVKNYISKMLED